MLSVRNINNQSSFTSNTMAINKINSVNRIYENVKIVSNESILTTGTPYTIDYNLGSVFMIPSNWTVYPNFNLIIKNIPSDRTKTYTLTIIFYQPTNNYYCAGVMVYDTNNIDILGSKTAGTFGIPFFNGGTPLINNAPSLTVQTFTVFGLKYSLSSPIFNRYVFSNVANNY